MLFSQYSMPTSIGFLSFLLIFWSCTDSEQPVEKTVAGTGIEQVDQLSQAIESDSGNALLYHQRGRVFYEEGGFDEAISDLNHAIKLDSVNVEHYHLLADVYLDYYRSKQALGTMYRAVEIAPTRIPTWLKLGEFQLILKQHDLALKSAGQILRLDPVNAEAFFLKGLIHRDQGEIDQAIRSFKTAVESDAELVEGWLMLGAILTDQQGDEALVYFDNALRIDSLNITALHSKAFFLQNHERIDEALGIYKKINRINPQYADAFFNAGILYFEIDSLVKAYEQFNITVGVEPTRALAYYYRGVVSGDLGNMESAIADLKQCLTLDPENERAQKALSSLNK